MLVPPSGSRVVLAATTLLLVEPGCAPRPTAPPPATAGAPGLLRVLPTPRIVYSAAGMFDLVLVVEEGDLRYLRFGSVDGDDQSVISLSDPLAVPMEYIRYAAVSLAYTRGLARMLMIGLGGGTFTSLLRRSFPSMWIDIAEIDPVVVDVAKRFFGVKEDDRYKIHLGDGRAFVEAASERYDLVLVDAFGGDGIPEHLGSRDFFELVRGRLALGGVAVANIASADIEVQRALVTAFLEAFPLHACFETPDRGNLILVGLDRTPPGLDELRARAAALDEELRLPFRITDAAMRLGTGCI